MGPGEGVGVGLLPPPFSPTLVLSKYLFLPSKEEGTAEYSSRANNYFFLPPCLCTFCSFSLEMPLLSHLPDNRQSSPVVSKQDPED